MNIFVVRLNPDTRGGLPYTKYPTVEEYENIHGSSPMNGFHEAINFGSTRVSVGQKLGLACSDPLCKRMERSKPIW